MRERIIHTCIKHKRKDILRIMWWGNWEKRGWRIGREIKIIWFQ